MTTWAHFIGCCFATLVLCSARPVLGAPGDVEAAEALFHEARALMRTGHYAKACPKLEKSQELDPGLGTRLNLADCWERTGRILDAYQQFSSVALQAEALGDDERAQVARRRAQTLESQVARVVILVPEFHRVSHMQIRRNSTVVPEDQYNRVVAVAPGAVALEATAPHHVPWQVRVEVPRGGFLRMEVPMLIPRAREASPPPGTGMAGWVKPASIIGIGTGVLGLGLGTYFGWRASDLYGESERAGCDEQNRCSPNALVIRKRALTAGDAATVSFVAGGALLGAGVALYVWGQEASASAGAVAVRVRLNPRAGADAAVEGSF